MSGYAPNKQDREKERDMQELNAREKEGGGGQKQGIDVSNLLAALS
jgi:hypothetical protein